MHDKERTALVEHYLDDSPAPGHHSRGAPSWTVCWLRCVLLDWLASQQRTHWKIARTTEGGEGCAAYLESDGVISDTRNNATIYCIYFVSLPGLLLLQLSGRFLVLPRHGLMSCCVARSPSSLVHTMYCTVVYRSNSASILVLNLDPGTFRFICSSPGEEFKTLSSTKQFMPMFFLFSFFFPSSSSNVLHPLCYSFNPQKENPKAPKNRKVTFFFWIFRWHSKPETAWFAGWQQAPHELKSNQLLVSSVTCLGFLGHLMMGEKKKTTPSSNSPAPARQGNGHIFALGWAGLFYCACILLLLRGYTPKY